MPRQKTQKQKITTRREKQDKRLKEKMEKNIEVFDEVETKAKLYVATYRDEDWEPPTYTPDKITLDKEFVKDEAGMTDKLESTFEELLDTHKKKHCLIWFIATPDQRLEAFYEESRLNRRVIHSYMKQDPNTRLVYASAIIRILEYLDDIKLTLSRIRTLINRRLPFQSVIDRYEADISPRPHYTILSICFKKDLITPDIYGSEPIPKKEMNYRIRQYQAWFYFQYYLHCAPIEKGSRHCKLKYLLQDGNSDTRKPKRQMQMPKDGDFKANYRWLLPIFLESVIQKGGKDSECIKLLSVLPPLTKPKWPKNVKYRPTKYYDIYGGKRNKTVYDVDGPPVSKPTGGPPVSETAEWTPVYEVD